MQTVNIEVTNRRASVIGAPVLVCNNTGDIVKFTFDEEWADVEQKTARFVYTRAGKALYQEVNFTGDTVTIPPLSHVREVKIGVYAGALTTTTAARVPYEPSILCEVSDETVNAYELGRQAEYDKFWNGFQNYGSRNLYAYAFYMWPSSSIGMFYPKYDIKPEGNAEAMFRNCDFSGLDMAERLESCGVKLDLSETTASSYLFYTTVVKRLPELDLRGFVHLTKIFGYSTVERIDKLIFKDTGEQRIDNMFTGAKALAHIDIEGVIGQTIDFSSAPLTPQSMKNVLTHLKNYTGTDSAFTYSVYFREDCWAALEAEGSTSPNGNSWRDYCNDLSWGT